MSDAAAGRSMSEDAMLASLRDIHLPEMAAGGMPADLAVILGLAALAAALLGGLLRLVSRQRKVPARDSLREELARLAQEPEEVRRVALLHLLRARAPERYAEIRGALYRPGGGIETRRLEEEVARLA